MKMTQRKLKRIIKEEIQKALNEADPGEDRWEPIIKSVEVEKGVQFDPALRGKIKTILIKNDPVENEATAFVQRQAAKIKKRTPAPSPAEELPGANKGVEQIKAWLKGAAANERSPFWGLKAYIKKMPPPEVLAQWARLIKNRPVLFATVQKYYAPETVEG